MRYEFDPTDFITSLDQFEKKFSYPKFALCELRLEYENGRTYLYAKNLKCRYKADKKAIDDLERLVSIPKAKRDSPPSLQKIQDVQNKLDEAGKIGVLAMLGNEVKHIVDDADFEIQDLMCAPEFADTSLQVGYFDPDTSQGFCVSFIPRGIKKNKKKVRETRLYYDGLNVRTIKGFAETKEFEDIYAKEDRNGTLGK